MAAPPPQREGGPKTKEGDSSHNTLATGLVALCAVTACILVFRNQMNTGVPTHNRRLRAHRGHTGLPTRSIEQLDSPRTILSPPSFKLPLSPAVEQGMGETYAQIFSGGLKLRSLLDHLPEVGRAAARPHGYRGDRRRLK
eukprot:CAMPEP_0206294112 /NCGR_PEP_ID=MMETSP0106_2-20121207/4487_1 /ASSEMBLY_ACC=CAM_ASM_000206 /TAXON_ID=81532 /ORGANISM="Acanthoeca-like sp., Strain 10tr" /LENGTH=139 /DNA_ID=CAMNT_0053724733 /DNA_START=200 /DNA_END=616 /DNA_ORIENTATION=+